MQQVRPPPIRKLRAASQTDVLSAGDSGCWDSACMRPRFGSRPPVSTPDPPSLRPPHAQLARPSMGSCAWQLTHVVCRAYCGVILACVHVSCGPRGRCAVNPPQSEWRAAGVDAVAAHGMCPAAPGCAWVHLLCASLSALPALLCLSRILRVLRVRQGRGQRCAPRPTKDAQRLSDAEATENSSTAALPASLQIGVPTSHPCFDGAPRALSEATTSVTNHADLLDFACRSSAVAGTSS